MHTSKQQSVQSPPDSGALRPRYWSVNGRFLSRHLTGVDRYALEILRSIDSLIGARHPLTAGIRLEILCPAEAVEASPFVNIPLRLLPSAPGHFWEQFVLPGYVHGGLLSLCNTGPLATKKQILCIHDVNTRLVPQSYSFAFRTAYRMLQPALAKRAAEIVTVSRFSQQAMARFGIAPADEIKVVYDGYEHVLTWNANQAPLKQTDLPHPFVLLIGSNAPHKNTAVIYSIAAELARKEVHVLVAGGVDTNVYARTRDRRLPENVRHLGRVDDDDLALLYKRALCLVFPSLTEGFGLPVLEAMALGCPVISSDLGGLPEVCGGAALYASPHDGPAWLAAIDHVACDPSLRDRLVAEGRKRSQLFSWRRSAEQYLELMFALDHDSDRRRLGRRQTAQRARSVLPENEGNLARVFATIGKLE
ncbi:MAG: glycosyltransferase family 1 protein [Xanthobacteraceae bacterium]